MHIVEKGSDDVVCRRRIWKPDRDDGCPHSCTCLWPYTLHNPCIQPSRWYCSSIRLVVSHQSIGTCMIFFGMLNANYCAHKTFFSCLRFARSKISHSKWSESIWIFWFFFYLKMVWCKSSCTLHIGSEFDNWLWYLNVLAKTLIRKPVLVLPYLTTHTVKTLLSWLWFVSN